MQGINSGNATNQQNYVTGLAGAQANAVNGQQQAQAPAMNWAKATSDALGAAGTASNLVGAYNQQNAAPITYQYGNSLNGNLPSSFKQATDTASSTALARYS